MECLGVFRHLNYRLFTLSDSDLALISLALNRNRSQGWQVEIQSVPVIDIAIHSVLWNHWSRKFDQSGNARELSIAEIRQFMGNLFICRILCLFCKGEFDLKCNICGERLNALEKVKYSLNRNLCKPEAYCNLIPLGW